VLNLTILKIGGKSEMKKLSKRLIAILLASIMLIAITAGCSSKSNASSTKTVKKIKIGMSFQEMNNPYFISMKKALEQATKEIGADLIIADAQHDVSKQINDIDDMLQKNIDILLINPTDSKGVEAAVESAKKAGVIVVAVDAQAAGPIDSFVGSKNYDAGYIVGKKMAEDLGGKGKVAILDGIPVVPILERVRGFKAAVAKYPGIQIVNTQNGKQDRAEAMKVTENMLQANPDLNAIFSVNDEGALGSLSAIQSSGKDVKLYSVDGNPEAVKAILEGNIFKATAAQFPRDQVRIALGLALAKLWGAKVVPKEVPIDVKLLTKDNAKGFSW
jgi:ribose transport system substrate-binding protein